MKYLLSKTIDEHDLRHRERAFYVRRLCLIAPYGSYQQFFCASYSQGLGPIEYFFHCQGGREGLVNTGVDTSDASYIL